MSSAGHGLGRARSWLYVPAHRSDLVAKALAGPSDAVVLDLEDAVAAAVKPTARDQAARRGREARSKPLWVRMNAVASRWAADDVAGLARSGVDGVRVPKAADPGAAADLASRLNLPLHLLVESALGVENAFALARAHPLVAGVSLGEADLAADLGVTDPAALAWARQRTVVANRAAGLPGPVASVWTDLSDPQGLAADSAAAHAQGFSGRSVIHPGQVEHVNRAFTPSADDVARARALVDSLDEASARGESACVDADGHFVDPAVAAGARRVLEQAGHHQRDQAHIPGTTRAAAAAESEDR